MVVGLTLFPVRLVVLGVLIVLDFVVAKVATLGLSLSDDGGCLRHEMPIVGWRKSLLWIIWLTNRAQLWCFGFWAVDIEDRRRDRSRQANLLVGAPHMSLADVYLVAHAFPPCPAGVGKAEMARLPFLSAKAIAAQSVFLDRSDRDSRTTCKATIAKRARASWRGSPLLVFPEGTTTNGKVLIQFKLGAFLPGEPVQPLTLSYPHRHHDPSWVGKNSNMVVAALRLMCQVYNRAKVTIFETYTPSEAERADPALFAANVRALMARSLGVQTTEHTYDDVYLSMKLVEANVSSDFEVESVKRLYDFDNEQLLGLLKKFRAFDKSNRGVITRSEFCHALGLAGENEWGVRTPASIIRLFAFLDTDDLGTISYREFVQVAALLSGKCSLKSQVQFAFLVYDFEGIGKVSVDLLKRALDYALAHGGSTPNSAAPPPSAEVFARVEKQELTFAEFEVLATRRPEVLQRALDTAEDRVGRLLPDGVPNGVKKKAA